MSLGSVFSSSDKISGYGDVDAGFPDTVHFCRDIALPAAVIWKDGGRWEEGSYCKTSKLQSTGSYQAGLPHLQFPPTKLVSSATAANVSKTIEAISSIHIVPLCVGLQKGDQGELSTCHVVFR